MAAPRPLVSIVMAAWNPRPDWLLEAVRSALDQRGVDLELLVVDDGSDTPLEVVLGGIEDPRLRIVRLDHEGASAARNAGVAAGRGEFIRFVDADDVLEPDNTARPPAPPRGGPRPNPTHR